ncbi:unnamed protein product [Gordionus sp. m RMFG-2023]
MAYVNLHCLALVFNLLYIFKRLILCFKGCTLSMKVKWLLLNHNDIAIKFRKFTSRYSKEKNLIYTNRRKLLMMIILMEAVNNIYYIYTFSPIVFPIFKFKFICKIGDCVDVTIYYCQYLSKILLLYDDLLRIRGPCQYQNFNINKHIFVAVLVSVLFSSPKCFMTDTNLTSFPCNSDLSFEIHSYINICFHCLYFGVSIILLIIVTFTYWIRRRKICKELNCVPINTIGSHGRLTTNYNADSLMTSRTFIINLKYVKVWKVNDIFSLQIFHPYYIYILSSLIFTIPFLIEALITNFSITTDFQDYLHISAKYLVIFLIFSIYY